MERRERDIYLAALFYAKGVKLVRVDRDGKLCWFVFENDSECADLQQQFFSKTVKVEAKEYADAVRTLKDLIFAG